MGTTKELLIEVYEILQERKKYHETISHFWLEQYMNVETTKEKLKVKNNVSDEMACFIARLKHEAVEQEINYLIKRIEMIK